MTTANIRWIDSKDQMPARNQPILVYLDGEVFPTKGKDGGLIGGAQFWAPINTPEDNAFWGRCMSCQHWYGVSRVRHGCGGELIYLEKHEGVWTDCGLDPRECQHGCAMIHKGVCPTGNGAAELVTFGDFGCLHWELYRG